MRSLSTRRAWPLLHLALVTGSLWIWRLSCPDQRSTRSCSVVKGAEVGDSHLSIMDCDDVLDDVYTSRAG